MLDEDYREIDSFSTHVKPEYNSEVAPFIGKLTGITMGRLWFSPSFAEAITRFLDWCAGFNDRIEICEWSDSDLHQLVNEMKLKDYHPHENAMAYLKGWKNLQKEYDTAFETGIVT